MQLKFTFIGLPSMGRQLFRNAALACFLFLSTMVQGQGLITASDTIFCEGDSIQLEAPTGYLFTLWSTGDTLTDIYVDSAGWYYLALFDTSFNFLLDSILIHTYPPKSFGYVANVSSNTFCKGDSIILELSDGFTSYAWNNGSSSRILITHPDDDVHYVAEATDSNGCAYRIEIDLEMVICSDSCPELLSLEEKNSCADSIQIEAINGYDSYDWNDGVSGRIRWFYQSGWYVLEAEDSNGAVCKDSILIHLWEAKKLEIFTNPSPVYLCKGDSVVVELTTGFKEYWWNTGDTGSRNVLYPTEDKTLVIEAIDQHGCESRAEVKLYVDICMDSCEIDVYPGHSACKGDSIKLGAQEGYDDYDWSDGTDGRFRWVKESGWYKVRAENTNGSFCVDSVYIQFHEAEELEYWTSDDTICAGSEVVIELSENFKQYWWSKGGDGTRKVFKPEEDLNIVVEAVDSNGCEDRIEIHIEVMDCDTACEDLIQVWPDSTACRGDSVNLEARSGFADYDWADGKDGRLRWVKESGWYVLDAESSNGHHCYDSVYITFHERRELKIFTNPERAVLCPGDSIIVELSGGFVRYDWSTRHEGHRNVLHPEKSFVLVIEAIDSNGCESRATKEITVKDSCHNSTSDLEHNLRIYPNPSSGLITISTDQPQLIGKDYTISDIRGRTLISGLIEGKETTISLEDLEDGTYFLIINGSAYTIQKH